MALQHSGGGDASAPRNDSVFWRILEEETSEPAEGAEERGGRDVNRPTATVLTFTALCRLHALRGIMPLAFSACASAVRFAAIADDDDEEEDGGEGLRNAPTPVVVARAVAGRALLQQGRVLDKFGEWISAGKSYEAAAARLIDDRTVEGKKKKKNKDDDGDDAGKETAQERGRLDGQQVAELWAGIGRSYKHAAIEETGGIAGGCEERPRDGRSPYGDEKRRRRN